MIGMAEAAPMADRGYPGLATALAWIGISTVIVGLAIQYGAGHQWGLEERHGFRLACIGALICAVSLAVAP